MDTKKKIEQNLREAPRPAPPDGLLNRLKQDVSVEGIKTQQSALRRWFAPSGGTVSPWRIAAAVAIATMVLIPLTYAGSKVIKSYFVEVRVIETIKCEDGSIAKVGTATAIVVEPSEEPNEQEAQEIKELKEAGEFEKVLVEERAENGMIFRLYNVSYTLSNGKVITVNEIEGCSNPNTSGQ